jgi:hypothetical protein
MLSLKQQALNYAERGWKVLPLHFMNQDGYCSCGKKDGCSSPAKHPVLRHGLKDASKDPADISRWWDRWEYSNIGIVTGHESGFWCLDIDPRNGGDDSLADVELEYGELPTTLTAMTGGGGRHFLFKIPSSSFNCGKLREGIDIKGDGGYIVVAPSNHASGGIYRWANEAPIVEAPAWLMDLPKKVIAPLSFERTQVIENPRKVQEIASALAVMPSDDRDEWLYVGMALNSAELEIGGATAYKLWDEWSKKSAKYNPTDSARVWDSFKRNEGVTLSTLFGLAKKYGFNTSQPVSAVDSHKQIGEVKLIDYEERVMEMPDYLLNPKGMLGEIVDYIDSTSVRPQRALAVASALTLLGTVFGRRYATDTGLRSNIYVIGVGATGCGKNHARTAVKKILHASELSNRMGGEELASGQAILSRVAMTPTVLFQLDEFGMLMSAIANPNAGTHMVAILSSLMKLFSSANETYIGTEYADQDKRPRVEIECPCVSVYGTTTPETFYKALGSGHVVSGYLNRMLVVETHNNRPKRQRVGNKDVPRSIINWVQKASGSRVTIDSLASSVDLTGMTPSNPIVVPMSKGAEELFDAYDIEIDRLMDKDRGSGLDALHNRAWEHSAKIAMLVALSRSLNRPTITVEDAEWAITFVKWSQSKMIAEVESRVSDSPFQAKVKECLLTIVKAGKRGLTARDMGRIGAWAKLQVKERESVLEALTIAGQVAEVEIPTKGRTRVAWVAIE